MYEKFFRIWGSLSIALAAVGVAHPPMWKILFGIEADSGTSLALAFCFVFIGLLLIACSLINQDRVRLVVCLATIIAQLTWLGTAVYNAATGYEANLATVVLLNLVAVVVLMIIASRQRSGASAATSV